MPSETPKMPGENHRTLLRFGESRGLGLQAGEVAWYPNKNDPGQRISRIAKRVGYAALFVSVLSLAVGYNIS